MWYTATMGEFLHDARDYGFDIENRGFSWPTIKEKRDAYIKRLNGIYHSNIDKANIEKILGHATFVDKKTVEVDGVRYTADHIVIAVGGKPHLPDIPGVELGIDSDGAGAEAGPVSHALPACCPHDDAACPSPLQRLL